MLVPFVEPVTTFTYNRQMLEYYIQRQHDKQEALPASEVDSLLEAQETSLLKAAAPQFIQAEFEREPTISNTLPSTSAPIWNRASNAQAEQPSLKALPRKRGPKADIENHEKVVSIVRAYGESWSSDANLLEICDELDKQQVPAPKTWASRTDGVARTWSRGRHHYQHLVIKAIKDRLKASGQVC